MKRTQRTTLFVLTGLLPAAQAAPEPEKAARSSALASQTIAAGDWHTRGLWGDGNVACWGGQCLGESTSSGGTFCEV